MQLPRFNTLSKKTQFSILGIGVLGLVLFLTINVSLQTQEQRSKASTGDYFTRSAYSTNTSWKWVDDSVLGYTPTTTQYAQADVSGLIDADHNAGFEMQYVSSSSLVRVAVSGTIWKIETSQAVYNGSFSHSSSGNLRVEISGSTVNIYWNGSLIVSKTIAGNTSGTGIAPTIWQSSTGVTMSNIQAGTPSAPATPTTLPTNTPVPSNCSGLTVVTPLQLDKSSVSVGGTINGTITYKNPCSTSIVLADIMIAARDNNSNNKDFSNESGNITLQPGQTYTVNGHRTITSSDSLGQWFAFGSYEDANNVWHEESTKQYFTVATSQVTNTPSPTVKPTATDTPIPLIQTPTPQPTDTPVPTATPVPNATQLAFTLALHGLGNGGDNSNSTSQGNFDILRPQRNLNIDIYDSSNNLVISKQGIATFNTTSGKFEGTIDIGNTLASNVYTIKVKTDQFLRAIIPGIQSITAGQTAQLPETSMIAGDINNDNQLNILDYNILMDCYSDLLPAISCDATGKANSDLNDDGNVNQYDYNLFLRELNNRAGQ